MNAVCPRILIAGANSGVGKTSVTLGLVSALTRRGVKVQTFKVGPDYLDPTYHSAASGRPCYNLDGWMTDREHVRSVFSRAAADAEIAVIEGVMGLFDGADAESLAGSSAEIAVWLAAPVLLVVNAHGLARSIAPIVKGFAEFHPDVNLAGVIANRCGSQRHGEMLARCLGAEKLPELVGAIPRGAFERLPSRHLGLVTADSTILTPDVLDSLADAAEAHTDVDGVIAAANGAPQIPSAAVVRRPAAAKSRVRIGLARDEAFHFYYQDNLEALEAAGCELVPFSPVRDATVPRDVDGLIFGGGYPEEHAAELSRNRGMIESVRRFAESGKVIYGECGGLMYLCRGIETLDGDRHNLVGLLPAWTRMLPRLKSLGYVEVELLADSLFGSSGFVLRGHEFHYSELTADPAGSDGWRNAYQARTRLTNSVSRQGFQRGGVLISYVHLHFASQPEAAERFVSFCRRDHQYENEQKG